MKNFLISTAIIISLVSCQSADNKAGGKPLTREEKDAAVKDSARYTSIQWLDSTFVDLGKLKEGSVVEVPFRFKNTGNNQLVFSNVSPGCGCTLAESPEKPVAPGEEGVIKAKFDSKGQHKGENRKYVNVVTNTNPPDTKLEFRVEITD